MNGSHYMNEELKLSACTSLMKFQNKVREIVKQFLARLRHYLFRYIYKRGCSSKWNECGKKSVRNIPVYIFKHFFLLLWCAIIYNIQLNIQHVAFNYIQIISEMQKRKMKRKMMCVFVSVEFPLEQVLRARQTCGY